MPSSSVEDLQMLRLIEAFQKIKTTRPRAVILFAEEQAEKQAVKSPNDSGSSRCSLGDEWVQSAVASTDCTLQSFRTSVSGILPARYAGPSGTISPK
jgi:hypothetical protein